MSAETLVRYGAIAEVARFVNGSGADLSRGVRVVVQTHRGIEVGTLLENATGQANGTPPSNELQILRLCSEADERAANGHRAACEQEFADWSRRIADWKVALELIDLEWTLDKSKLILYVLNDRGAECTKLALHAATAGLGVVEVQPVGPEGAVPQQRESGCGSGGCGSGGDGGCCH